MTSTRTKVRTEEVTFLVLGSKYAGELTSKHAKQSLIQHLIIFLETLVPRDLGKREMKRQFDFQKALVLLYSLRCAGLG